MKPLPSYFKNAKVRQGYDKEQQIYSVKVYLNDKPRIITMRVGKNFTELSLSDETGKVLEVMRQEDGKGIVLSKKKK